MDNNTILVINGPNLNLLGTREPEVYGNSDFESYFKGLQEKFDGTPLEYYQSNIEGELIDKLQQAGFTAKGIVINAGAYTHTSVGIGDAIAAIETPVIEVHISNVYAREEFRHHSHLARYCTGVICGFGLHSYDLAIQHFVEV